MDSLHQDSQGGDLRVAMVGSFTDYVEPLGHKSERESPILTLRADYEESPSMDVQKTSAS